jgi:hypothetical protein
VIRNFLHQTIVVPCKDCGHAVEVDERLLNINGARPRCDDCKTVLRRAQRIEDVLPLVYPQWSPVIGPETVL